MLSAGKELMDVFSVATIILPVPLPPVQLRLADVDEAFAAIRLEVF
jgi:hypothetical protein